MYYRALALLVLCVAVVVGIVGPGSDVEARPGALEAEFGAAAEEFGVPKELLLAMGYVNTRWEMPPPSASDYERGEIESRGIYGIMALAENPSNDTLGVAAGLTGESRETLKTDRRQNIRGGAAVLADLAGEEKPADLNGWYDALAAYGDGAPYADQVFEVLKSGASAKTKSGERLKLAPQPVEPPMQAAARLAADYPAARFYGAHPNNYTPARRPYSPRINKIVIHVTQGSYSSALNWFNDPRAYVSAHYTVSSRYGVVGQSVREKNIAYHAGNWRYNKTSIGIEHEGFVSDPAWFTDAMYRSSAKLTAYLSRKYRIPVDRYHIIGHNQVPYATHTDPGRYWNWDKYMYYVRYYR